MARLQAIAPGLRRVGLSATIADPAQYAAWLAPDSRGETVTRVDGEAGPAPALVISLPAWQVPWAGTSGCWAVDQVLDVVVRRRTAILRMAEDAGWKKIVDKWGLWG